MPLTLPAPFAPGPTQPTSLSATLRARVARWLRTLLLVGLPVVSGCASLDEWQRQKIYRPTAVPTEAQWQDLLRQRPDTRAFAVPAQTDGQKIVVLELPASPDRGSGVRVLFLHGTFRHAFQNLAKAEPMRSAGLDVLMPDYRGWGASTPLVPSEQTIHADAWSVWQALQAKAEAPAAPVRWVIYGHSMGSAVAVELASRLRGSARVCAVVLESAFTSFDDVAQAGAGWIGGAVSGLGSQRMASIERIDQLDVPVWFLHGSRDETVPIALGRRLYERAREPRHWYEWPLGHSNLQTDPTGGYARVWQDIARSCARP